MKTLKKTLCLVLAVVMVVGVLIIPANAADTTAADAEAAEKAAQAKYAEALAVLDGLGIMTGDEDGFRANDTITRQEAAAVVARLKETDAVVKDYPTGGLNFADCTASTVWGRSYIAYCTAENIATGDEEGFRPEDDVTGYEFLKMILVALGYDPDIEQFRNVGNAWTGNVYRVASRIGLTDDVTGVSWTAPIKRGEVAQVAFNALQKNQVYYTGGTEIEINGAVIRQGATLQGETVEAADTDGILTNSLAKKLYKLSKTDENQDAFGRPLVEYSTPETTVASIPQDAVKVYSGSVDAKTVAADLKNYSLGDAKSTKVTETTPGEEITATGIKYENSAKGADFKVDTSSNPAKAIAELVKNNNSVEIYANAGVITHIVIVTRKADKVAANSGTNDKPVYKLTTANTLTVPEKYNVSEDNIVVYTSATDSTGANEAIQSLDVISGLTATVDKYDSTGTKFTINGTEYTVSENAVAGTDGNAVKGAVGKETVYYLDGNTIVHMEEVKDDNGPASNYIYVLGYQVKQAGTAGPGDLIDEGDAATDPVAKARVLDLATGDVSVVDIALGLSGGKWYYLKANGTVGDEVNANVNYESDPTSGSHCGFRTYVKLSDGRYVFTGEEGTGLTKAGAVNLFAIAKGDAKVTVNTDEYIYATNNTKLIIVSSVTGEDGYSVDTYEGYKNFVAVTAGSTTKVAGYTKDADANITAIYVHVENAAASKTPDPTGLALYIGKGDTTKDGAEYKFVVAGKEVVYIGAADFDSASFAGSAAAPGTVYKVEFAEDGKISKISATEEKPVKESTGLKAVVAGEYVVMNDEKTIHYLAADCYVYDATTAKTGLKASSKVEMYKKGGSGDDKDQIILIVIRDTVSA